MVRFAVGTFNGIFSQVQSKLVETIHTNTGRHVTYFLFHNVDYSVKTVGIFRIKQSVFAKQ